VPLPHVVEHVDHADHALVTQFTGKVFQL
jgi:hypothetical protein